MKVRESKASDFLCAEVKKVDRELKFISPSLYQLYQPRQPYQPSYHYPNKLYLAMQKNCSKCGSAFDCCNEIPGCWCENLQLDQQTLDALKNNFDNCLCPACLKTYEKLTTDSIAEQGL